MSSNGGIKVMLVDDHPVMRRGLREVLQDSGGFEVVAEAPDGVEAVARAEESRPDVIVMDVMMPNKDGVEACRDILDLLPDTKVVMLTASAEDDAVIEAIAAGATGFVQKYTGSDELVDTVRQVVRGQLVIPDDAVRRVFRLVRSGTALMPGPKVLTVREREVLIQFARGKPNARIAEVMGIGRVTVRNTIYRIQDKLGLGPSRRSLCGLCGTDCWTVWIMGRTFEALSPVSGTIDRVVMAVPDGKGFRAREGGAASSVRSRRSTSLDCPGDCSGDLWHGCSGIPLLDCRRGGGPVVAPGWPSCPACS